MSGGKRREYLYDDERLSFQDIHTYNMDPLAIQIYGEYLEEVIKKRKQDNLGKGIEFTAYNTSKKGKP